MCCDLCPRFDECESRGMLKDACCKRCPEYKYCQGEKEFYDRDSVYGSEYNDYY